MNLQIVFEDHNDGACGDLILDTQELSKLPQDIQDAVKDFLVMPVNIDLGNIKKYQDDHGESIQLLYGEDFLDLRGARIRAEIDENCDVLSLPCVVDKTIYILQC